MMLFMAKMKYWNGTTWEVLDAKNADTVDGKRADTAATANTVIVRDANGRAKVAAPSASDDIARKAEVDTKVSKSGDTMTGILTVPNLKAQINISSSSNPSAWPVGFVAGIVYNNGYPVNYGTIFSYKGTSGNSCVQILQAWPNTDGGEAYLYIRSSRDTGADVFGPWRKVWSENNDGAGSGLDADLWRGKSFLDVGLEYQAGNNIVVYNDSDSVSTPATSYTEKKACIIGRGGTVRISFTLSSFSSSITVYGRIYKNGVAVGTERSTTSTTPVVFTEDIAVSQNDRISLYLRTSRNGNPAFSREFVIRVNYDGSTYKVIL
jgi:hypothetical protein